MEELKLKRANSWYEGRNPYSSVRTCEGKEARYCYQQVNADPGAKSGFLGRIGRVIDREYNGPKWEEIGKTPEAVYRTVQNKESENYQWKAALDCIMDNVLEVQEIAIQTLDQQRTVWKKGNWSGIIKDGAGSYWGSTAKLQRLISSIMCIVAAMLTDEDQTKNRDSQLRKRCGDVYRAVKIDLKRLDERGSRKNATSHDEFLDGVIDVEQNEGKRLDGLGFLLTVAYAVSTCCEYRRGLTLGKLINRQGWDLNQLSPCYIEGTKLNCGAVINPQDKGKVNIWKTGESLLIEPTPHTGPERLRLTNTETREELVSMGSTYRPNSQSSQPPKAIKETAVPSPVPSGRAGEKTDTKAPNPPEDVETPYKGAAGSQHALATGTEADQGKQPIPAQEEAKSRGEHNTGREDVTTKEKESIGDGATGTASSSRTIQQEETQSDSSQVLANGISSTGGKSESFQASPEENRGWGAIGLGVGGALTVVLGVMSMYGLWRVIFRRRRIIRGRNSTLESPLRVGYSQ
ncbi:hypothetical protein C922_05465 [Plasmodium inui San Antonio 1]|uniref:Uncharacterized protein n=1 Tax=Plasmodium inui San Antonio 1 TaxID=1237626 RepID=W7A4X0_9APIC|nr:hypothetical protein C922_05465 [Plasmodium inui San Antonio 1]EUD64149.1 hypothetical protein C922_05465 [Plasmodium inui San Antonio 1]